MGLCLFVRGASDSERHLCTCMRGGEGRGGEGRAGAEHPSSCVKDAGARVAMCFPDLPPRQELLSVTPGCPHEHWTHSGNSWTWGWAGWRRAPTW